MKKIEAGTRIADRFEIMSLAGLGGMGAVYRARDLSSGKQIALKVMLNAATGNKQRFLREASILSALSHPNIVQYIANGELSDGSLYLAMEWLEGEDLAMRLTRGALSLKESLEVIRASASALSVAHRGGIIHRDIKPSNLFLLQGRTDQLKILDFGLARPAQAAQMTRTGLVLGTPGYIAPEQAIQGAKGLTESADIFALGCVLFECLLGRPAFQGENILAILSKVLLEEPPPLRVLYPEASIALEELLGHMLSKSPAARPQSGDDLLQRLEQLQRSEPTSSLNKPSTLTSGEQRLLCIVMVKQEGRGLTVTVESGDTIAEDTLHSQSTRFGGKIAYLINGSLLISFYGDGAATDLVTRAARCALSLRAENLSIPISIVMGRAQLDHHLPVSDLIDRGVRLLHISMGDSIRLDSGTAGFLNKRFLLVADDHGALLSQEMADDAAPTLLGRRIPCIGRDRELLLLESAYSHSYEEPCSRAVLVLAHPGVGKSRLREEFVQRLKMREDPPLLLMAYGDPLAQGSSFALVAQLIRGTMQLFDDDEDNEAQQKIKGFLTRSISSPEKLARIAEFLGELVGVSFPDDQSPQLRAARSDSQLMGDQLRLALEGWLSAEASLRPVVIVIEDLHWGDPPSVRLIDAALRHLKEKPLMVLALARPDIRSQFPSLWAERGLEELHLPDLSRKASERLIQFALGSEIDPAIRANLIEHAAGNAFYLEELIRATHQGKLEKFPETVLAMAQSRLEGLPVELRRTLRAASVFGQAFWHGGLVALLDPGELRGHLQRLLHQEFLVLSSASKFEGEEEYSFRHALLREASYLSLTEEDKRLGHKLAAQWLESSQEKQALVLADHFKKGGEAQRAIPYYTEAAQIALEGNDFNTAITCAESGIHCGATTQALGLLLLVQAEAHNWRAEFSRAEPLALRAMELLPHQSQPWLHALAEALLASGRRGNNELLLSLSKQLHSLSWAEPVETSQIICLNRASSRLLLSGYREQGLLLVARMRALSQARDLRGEAWLKMSKASVSFNIGFDASATLKLVQESIDAFLRIGDLRNATLEMTSRSALFQFMGVWDEQLAREVISMATGRIEAMSELYLARVFLHQKKWREGEALLSSILARASTQEDHQMEGLCRTVRAELHLTEGELLDAERELRLAQHKLSAFASLLCSVWSLLSRVLLQQDRAREALDAALEAIRRLPPEHFVGASTAPESKARLCLIEALLRNGKQEEALAALDKACDRLKLRAENLSDPSLRESFLKNIPENVALMALANKMKRTQPA